MTEYFYIEPVYVDPNGSGYGLDGPIESPHIEWWPGDDLVQWEGGYLVTKVLGDRFDDSSLTGYELSDVSIETTDDFESEHPNEAVPAVYEFEVTGTGYRDDFGIGYVYNDGIRDFGERLIISSRARELLGEYDIEYTHELERIEDEDVLRPELGLEEAIDRFLDDPTVRNEARVVCRILEHTWEIPYEPGTEREEMLVRLRDILIHEEETEETVRRVARRDESRPADQDPVSYLYEILESTEGETET